MVMNTLFKKQEDLATAREKIQANEEGLIINPAIITKILIAPAALYFNNVAAVYPHKTAVIYFNKTPNLSELKNPQGV